MNGTELKNVVLSQLVDQRRTAGKTTPTKKTSTKKSVKPKTKSTSVAARKSSSSTKSVTARKSSTADSTKSVAARKSSPSKTSATERKSSTTGAKLKSKRKRSHKEDDDPEKRQKLTEDMFGVSKTVPVKKTPPKSIALKYMGNITQQNLIRSHMISKYELMKSITTSILTKQQKQHLDSLKNPNALFIQGPTSCGKKSIIRHFADTMFLVKEIDLNEIVQQLQHTVSVLGTTRVGGIASIINQTLKIRSVDGKPMIIVVSNIEEWFQMKTYNALEMWTKIIQNLKAEDNYVIFTCNNPNEVNCRKLSALCATVKMMKLDAYSCTTIIQDMYNSKFEQKGVKFETGAIRTLVKYSDHNMRVLCNMVDWILKDGALTLIDDQFIKSNSDMLKSMQYNCFQNKNIFDTTKEFLKNGSVLNHQDALAIYDQDPETYTWLLHQNLYCKFAMYGESRGMTREIDFLADQLSQMDIITSSKNFDSRGAQLKNLQSSQHLFLFREAGSKYESKVEFPFWLTKWRKGSVKNGLNIHMDYNTIGQYIEDFSLPSETESKQPAKKNTTRKKRVN
jgi:hypothetical protein